MRKAIRGGEKAEVTWLWIGDKTDIRNIGNSMRYVESGLFTIVGILP